MNTISRILISAFATSTVNATFAPLIKALFSQSGLDLGYGCWCHFNTNGDFGHGKGEPVDGIDKMCKVLAHGYDCVGMDTGGCDPFAVEYGDISGQIFNLASDMNVFCEQLSPGDDCAINTCKVESHFSKEYLREVFSATLRLNSTFKHDNFDQSTCATAVNANGPSSNVIFNANSGNSGSSFSTGGGSSGSSGNSQALSSPLPANMCCGTFPVRFPYKTNNGGRSCCNQVTFNALVYECCDGQTVTQVGNCL